MNKKCLKYINLLQDKKLLTKVSNTLTDLFPKQEGKAYSVGFNRWLSLTKKQRASLYIRHGFDSNKIKSLLQEHTVEQLLQEEKK
jgi:hypothetical protein